MSQIEMNSFSSHLMFNLTLYRNQPGALNKLVAQAGYILISIVAAVETVVALAFSALTYPFSSVQFERSTKRLNSSLFTIGWSLTDALINILVQVLVADEKSAHLIYQSGNLTWIPPDAVLK